MMGKAAKTFIAFAFIAIVLAGMWATVRIVKEVEFKINCTQYLKRAADANTVETAKEGLGRAISYAEENGLTKGVVSIFLEQPKNDIGYWYRNMTEAYDELGKLSDNATPLEKTNVLMKLRETLADSNKDGISITVPDGISIYPNNVAFFWWGLLSWLMFFFFLIMTAVAYLNYWN